MQDSLDITTMTVEQLESLAYRLVEQKSNVEMNLATIQQQLQRKREQSVKDPT